LIRKRYRRAEYLFLLSNYRQHSAPALSAALDRTPGSLYRFINRRPELRKQEKV
jgi:hypothetical protein